MPTTFISHNFNLPIYENELAKAAEVIEKLKDKLSIIEMRKAIDDKIHETLFEEIIKVLDYVGKLSNPAFEIEDKLEELYTIKYKSSPNLGKQLWLEHYESIHHPYNILKNRCFRLIEELDDLFIKLNNRKPKNWNL